MVLQVLDIIPNKIVVKINPALNLLLILKRVSLFMRNPTFRESLIKM